MYLTVQEFLDRFNTRDTELFTSEDEQMDGWDSGNEDILNICISDASSEIDSYLRGTFILPIVNIPDKIKRICAEITVKYLYDRKNLYDEDADRDFKRAIKDLEKIKKGTIDLELPELTEDNQTGAVHFPEGKQNFSQSSLSGY